METNKTEHEMIVSTTGKRELKKDQKDSKMGWYVFLFFIFLLTYAYFAFVYFK